MATYSSTLAWKIQENPMENPRSVVGYSPWGRKELDMTERLHFHFHTDSSPRPSEQKGCSLALRPSGGLDPSVFQF